MYWIAAIAIRTLTAISTFSLSGLASATVPAVSAVIAALVASAILRLQAKTLRLMAAFAAIDCVRALLELVVAARVKGEMESPWVRWEPAFIASMAAIMMGAVLWRNFAFRSSRVRQGIAIFVVAAIAALPIFSSTLDKRMFDLAMAKDQSDEERRPIPKDIDEDVLWESQTRLINGAIAKLLPAQQNRTNVYVIAVAPQGHQALFSREAKAALKLFATRYGKDARGGILLSNDQDDIEHTPLATRGNIAEVIKGIGARMHSDRDVLVIYLASHGSDDAIVQTGLPDYSSIQSISADTLASALDAAHIQREIVIVSACHAGSWAPALSDDDNVLVAAAAADRTSFGCSDERRMTYFGEAFLDEPLARSGSLAEAFAKAKKTIGRWEKAEGLTPSMPEAVVGRNMQAFWNAPPPSAN